MCICIYMYTYAYINIIYIIYIIYICLQALTIKQTGIILKHDMKNWTKQDTITDISNN